MHTTNVIVDIKNLLLNHFLGFLPNNDMECTVFKTLLRNPFIKTLTVTENLTSNTAYCTSMGETNYKLLLISNQITFEDPPPPVFFVR